MDIKSLLVDDQGQFWHEGSFALRARNYGLTSGSAFLGYALKNLGFVGVRQLGHGAVELRMRPRSVSETALVAATYFLWDKAPSRLVLTVWHENDWRPEIHVDPGKAFDRIASLLNEARPRSEKRIYHSPRHIASLGADDPFRKVVSAWIDSSGHSKSSGFLQRVAELSGNRYIVFEKDLFSGFGVVAFGTNQPQYALSWLRDSHDVSLHLQPDRDYAWSCEMAYTSALNRQAPVLEDVDALIHWHSTPGMQPLRRKYRRLLLPLRDGTRRRLLSITREDGSIDLKTAANITF